MPSVSAQIIYQITSLVETLGRRSHIFAGAAKALLDLPILVQRTEELFAVITLVAVHNEVLEIALSLRLFCGMTKHAVNAGEKACKQQELQHHHKLITVKEGLTHTVRVRADEAVIGNQTLCAAVREAFAVVAASMIEL